MRQRTKSFLFVLMFLGSSLLFGQNQKFSSPVRFDSKWDWDGLLRRSNNPQTKDNIKKLREIVSIDEARFILDQLSRLSEPERIKELSRIEKDQSEWGGGFYGVIPDYFADPDSIPVPDNWDNLIGAALYLSQIRKKNLEIVSNPAFHYRLRFTGQAFPKTKDFRPPKNWHLEIDLSVIEKLLNLFEQNRISMEQAQSVARDPIILEMLKHRRSLGYVPEPLPDSSDMAQFIFNAGSREPVKMIWKWLNPWNYFCLSDVYLNRREFAGFLSALKANRQNLERHILGQIAPYLSDDVSFNDRLGFAVNWGIRSWATEKMLGSNLVQFKDDYPTMLRTLTHETFHRFQLLICPADPSRVSEKPKEFEDLVSYDFPSEEDRKFYQALSYIMLEGSATYVGGIDSDWQADKLMAEGKLLLRMIFNTLYDRHNFTEYDSLINKGLKSNGPFYALGYVMSKTIVEKEGPKELGLLLKKGSLGFFGKYVDLVSESGESQLIFDSDLVEKIKTMGKE
ncbi:MAG: hypothetical protein GXO77_10590 [Calditrichaeota bacterium]|nr:hypothetical protein [Calditrichota bacterium]